MKIRQYDKYKISRFTKIKPRVIEMALSNICNLECIMCSGRYSSSIRKNRENLPTLESEFGYIFRKELQEYIPALQEAVFAGGEPFTIPLYYDIWEDIIRLNPDCEISLVTNGTILNDRIKGLLEQGNFKIILSFDSVNKENYEKIRKNASFEDTLKNMAYFDNYLKQRGKRLHIPICPLKENRFEIPDIVRFCNEKNYSLNFVTVTAAFSHAMWALCSEDLKQLKEYYLKQDFYCKDEISRKNIQEFNDLTYRIDVWIKEAMLRDEFELKFDLTLSKVEILKSTFFSNINESLRKVCNDEDDFNNKWELILSNFEETMNELPYYFESNHFYKAINNISSDSIINVLLNHHISSILEIANEIFYSSNAKK